MYEKCETDAPLVAGWPGLDRREAPVRGRLGLRHRRYLQRGRPSVAEPGGSEDPRRTFADPCRTMLILAMTMALLALARGAPAADIPDLGTRKQGVDWPKFLGPTGDSKSTEKGIITTWPATGPRLVWQLKLGMGYCMPAISRGRAFVFDRTLHEARLRCLES